jgi:hypothetical protein
MNEEKIIFLAERFLSGRNIGFVKPGTIGQIKGKKVEVIFLVPEALDPNVAIVDPPDVRVWVDEKTGIVELIPQM